MGRTKHSKTRHAGVFRVETTGQWFIQVSRRDALGKRHYRSAYLAPTMAEEEVVIERAKLARDLKVELTAPKKAVEKRAPSATVADYAERWLAGKARDVRASVLEHYTDVLCDRFLPTPARGGDVGELALDQLTRDDVQAWIRDVETWTSKRGTPYAQATLRSWWRPVKQMLRDAAAEFGLADPTRRVRPPRSTRRRVRETRTLSGSELARLLEAVRTHRAAWYPQVAVLAFTGMRPGELYALRVGDLDEEAGVVRIARSVRRGRVTETKTDEPREAALTPHLRRLIQAQRRQLLREQHPALEVEHPLGPLLFPADTGRHRGPESLLKMLGQVGELAEFEVKVGPQVLRRTFNTLVVESGAGDRVVLRAQLGHCSEEMTERYAGVSVEAKAAMVAQLEQLAGVVEGGA